MQQDDENLEKQVQDVVDGIHRKRKQRKGGLGLDDSDDEDDDDEGDRKRRKKMAERRIRDDIEQMGMHCRVQLTMTANSHHRQ
jgi:hypothetical protein